MVTGGLAQIENFDRIDFSLSLLGFYGKINSNILLGFNQTIKANKMDGNGNWWQYDRLYGLSYIQYKKQIGKGLFWRIDAGYANNEIVNIDYIERLQIIEGMGLMIGVGYYLTDKMFMEFDIHKHLYSGYNDLHWFAISFGGLF